MSARLPCVTAREVLHEHIGFASRQTGAEAAYPERAAASIGAVDVLPVALTQVLHQQGSAVATRGGKQQMRMVAHQHIGMDGAAVLVGLFA